MERGELTPIQRILNTLYSNAKLSGEHYTAAQQQYDNLRGKLKNLEKFYPQKYEAIKSNYEQKKKVIPEISKIKDNMKSRCLGLIKALELAVKLKKDEDGSARRELVMLLDTDYLDGKPKKGEDGRKKGGSTSSEKIEPNTIKMATLWEFLSDEKNMSLLDMSEQIAEQARGEFQQLRGEWEEILNREDKKVRSFLNSKDYPKKNSLSSMRVDDQDPLYKVMNRLAESKKILSQKDDIVYEYVTLVNVCTEFRRHAAPKREDVMKKVPAIENHPRGATNEKQTEERCQKSPERTRDEGSEVDQKSYLDILLQTYCEDMDINEDEKEKSRQEFLKLKILRGRYGPPKGSVPNVDPPKDGKLENIVNEDKKGVSESLFSVLRYGKKKGLEKWQLAAAEFGQLADVLISMAKEDHLGARPKVPGSDLEGKGSALYELLLKWDGADQRMKDNAKTEYAKISDRARKITTLKAEHQDLGQSVSMLNNPQDIPDDPESTTYNVLQILRATDPEGKKCRGAWNEYFCLLAEEQRFIRIVNQNQVKSGEQGSRLQVYHRQAPPFGDHSGKYVSQVQVPPPDTSGEVDVSSFVQGPCERQPQRIVIQEGEIHMPYSQWQQVKEELDRKTQEVDELSSRLDHFASQQNKEANSSISLKGKRKKVAESIKSFVSASVSGEEGGEGDGVVSKQDNQSENSKDAAKKVGDDRKQEHCEGAEGGRDDRKKISVETEEEEEEEEDAAYEFSLEQAALQLSKLETDIADTITLNTSQVNSSIHDLDLKRTSDVPETIYPPEHFVVQSVQVSSDHDDWKECGQHESHGVAEWKCINCRRTFCGACKEFHDKMVPKKHHLLHRSKREKEAIILKEIFCNIHLNKELEMYCITDNRAICVLCALDPSHKDHTIEELEKSADKIRFDVGVLLANVDKDYPKMEENLASVRKTIANASLPEYNDLVDKMMEKAIAQIKLNAANLKADEKRKADKLKKKEADLKSQQEKIQSKLLSSRKFLETCTDLQLVTQGKRYLQELGDIVLPDMSNDERPGQLTEVDIQQHIRRNIFS